MEYHDALEALEQGDAVLPHDDPGTREAQVTFERLFNAFTPDALRQSVRQTYAPEPFFNDTLKTVRERDALAAYLAESAEAVEQCTVEIDEWTPAKIGWYVRWRMTIRFKRFKRGVDTESIGVSHIVFDREGRVALHQDFWDSATGFYQHLPLLGGAIRWIRRRV